MKILALNIGSTSLKALGFDMPSENPLFSKKYEISQSNDQPYRLAIEDLLSQTQDLKWDAIVHRFVHGGESHSHPQKLNQDVIEGLRKWEPIMPLHLPYNVKAYEFMAGIFPEIPHYACFDNVCFTDLPKTAQLYALPRDLQNEFPQCRKFGYHGLSHQMVVDECIKKENISKNSVRLISCHLGGGSSVSAYQNGRFIDTSMGFGAMDGPVMTSRLGDCDPAVIFFLLQNTSLTAAQLETLCYKEAGLKAVSQTSGDMREIIKGIEQGDLSCQQAYDLYLYSIKKFIGSYLFQMGGLDFLILTGGIGENVESIQNEIREAISQVSEARLVVIPCKEELAMARLVYGELQ